MFVCHACRRRTQALRTGPQELTCARCGVVGFVEEFNQQGQSPSSDDFARRRDTTQPIRRNDPFDVMAAILREHEGLTRLTTGTPTQHRTVGGVTFVSTGPRNEGNLAILGNPDAFFHYLPDAFLSMITSENFDNLINLVMGQTGERGPPPAAASVRESLPWETLTAETANKYEECVICREPFAAGEKVRRMCTDSSKCPHAYHDQCIQEWLQRHNTCPICRYQLQTDDSGFENRRQTLERNLHRSLSSRSVSPQGVQAIPEQASAMARSPLVTQVSHPDNMRGSSSNPPMQASRSAEPLLTTTYRTMGSNNSHHHISASSPTNQHSQNVSSSQQMARSPLEPRSAPTTNTTTTTTVNHQQQSSPNRQPPTNPGDAMPSEMRPREPQPYHHANRQSVSQSEHNNSRSTRGSSYQDMFRSLGRAISRGFF